jgi:hypothetical protein
MTPLNESTSPDKAGVREHHINNLVADISRILWRLGIRGDDYLSSVKAVRELAIHHTPFLPSPQPAPDAPRAGVRDEKRAACTLADCPPGLFWFGDCLGFKSEYGDNYGNSEAFCVESGEYFWGGTTDKTAREKLTVTPFEEPRSAPRPKGRYTRAVEYIMSDDPNTEPPSPSPAPSPETGAGLAQPAPVGEGTPRVDAALAFNKGNTNGALLHVARTLERELAEAERELEEHEAKTFETIKNGLERQDALEASLSAAQSELGEAKYEHHRQNATLQTYGIDPSNLNDFLSARRVALMHAEQDRANLRHQLEEARKERDEAVRIIERAGNPLRFSELNAYLKGLEDELTPLRRDKARLDWLEAQRKMWLYVHVTGEAKIRNTDELDGRITPPTFSNVRSAIDSAQSAAKETKA